MLTPHVLWPNSDNASWGGDYVAHWPIVGGAASRHAALADQATFTDGVITALSFTLTSATAAFTAADTGRPISGPNIPLGTTISGYNSATSVSLSRAPKVTATGQTFTVIRESDATYLENVGGINHLYVGFPSFTIPPLAQVRRIDFMARASWPDYPTGSTDGVRWNEAYHDAEGVGSYSGLRFLDDWRADSDFASTLIRTLNIWTVTSPAIDFEETHYTQPLIDSLAMAVTRLTGTSRFRLYRLWLEIHVNEAPVVTITAPTGAQSAVLPISYQYSDPEGDPVDRWRFKVYPASVYNVAGFNPETSAGFVHDSGEQFGQPSYIWMPNGLPIGVTYRTYLKMADVGSGGRYGAWAVGPEFSMASGAGAWLDPPAVPLLTATPEPALGRVALAVRGQDNLLTRDQSSFESGGFGWEVEENLAGVQVATVEPQHGLMTGWIAPSTSGRRTTMRTYHRSGSQRAQADAGVLSTVMSTPHVAAHYVTDLDIEYAGTMDWTPAAITTLAAKDDGASLRSWNLQLLTTGILRLNWWDNAGTLRTVDSTANVAFMANGSRNYVRVTLDVDNGAAGHSVKFYWANRADIWNQVGATVTVAGVTTIRQHAAAITLNANGVGMTLPLYGSVDYFALRPAIDATTRVAHFDANQNGLIVTPATRTPATVVSALTGETWTGVGTSWTWQGVYDLRPATRHPVTAGVAYKAMASWTITDAGAAGLVRLLIDWFNAAGTVLSTSASAGQVSAIGVDKTETLVATAPAGAVSASLRIETNPTTTAATMVDKVAFAKDGYPGWSRGGLVLDRDRRVDTFTRPDSTTTMGTAESGGAWQPDIVSLPTWGIIGGRAYLVSDTPNAVTVLGARADTEGALLSDGVVEVDISLSATANRASAGLMLRGHYYAGSGLLVHLRKTATADDLRLIHVPTSTVVATAAGLGLINGQTYRLRVEAYGARVRVLIDGVVKIDATLSAAQHPASTPFAGWGLYVNSGATEDDRGTRFDNFTATSPPLQRFTLERSVDGGATWTTVRGAGIVVGAGNEDQLVTVYDHEAPSEVDLLYRAKTHATEADAYAESAYVTTGRQSLRLTGAVGTYAWKADTVANSVTGDLDVRAMVALDDWTPAALQAIASKYGVSGFRSWRFFAEASGLVRVTLSQDGVNGISAAGSSVNLATTPAGDYVGLRFTYRVSDNRVQYFTAPFTEDPAAAVWTQLGIDRILGTLLTGLFASTAPIEVGSRQTGTIENLAGNVAWVEVRRGIDGPVVAFFNATNAGPFVTGDAAPTARDGWTLAGAATIVGGDLQLEALGWWLKDPLDPSRNQSIRVAPPFAFTRKKPQAVYDPLGRENSVTVGDGVKGIQGQLSIWTKTKAEYDALEALLGEDRTLLLSDTLGRSWYVSFGEQEYQLIRAQPLATEDTPIRHFHQLTVPFVEVAPPTSPS